MKKTLLVFIALCFVCAGSFEAFSQKQTTRKKTVQRKLVKCKINGKLVYRTKCRTAKKEQPVVALQTPVIDERYRPITPWESDGPGTGGGQGSGLGSGRGDGSGSTEKKESAETTLKIKPKKNNLTQDVRFLSKPRAIYTAEARKNMVQGNVLLKVEFLANGTIGAVTPVSGLADGLTDQAIEAAKKIKFEPATRRGKPYSKTMTVSYSFMIY